MTKKETLKWRLSKLPTSEEVLTLIKDGVITKDEGREILFSNETIEDRDKKSLEAEIKFLRELVERLSQNQTSRIIETIKYVEKPYYRYDWYQPYIHYCATSSRNLATATLGNSLGGQSLTSASATNNLAHAFSAIKTF